VELGLILCVSVHNPVVSTYRLQHTDRDRLPRVLSAWSVSSGATIAVLTALWGVLADVTSPRTALVVAGVPLLATPRLLPRARHLAAAAARARTSELAESTS